MSLIALLVTVPIVLLPGPLALGILTAALVDTHRRRRRRRVPRTLETTTYKGCALLLGHIAWVVLALLIVPATAANALVPSDPRAADVIVALNVLVFYGLSAIVIAPVSGLAAFVAYLRTPIERVDRTTRSMVVGAAIGSGAYLALVLALLVVALVSNSA